ncbi:ROK family protein [Paenibacillus nasutitermitis]|uniref:Glucokinase n=1 Tax=Paenibacillus nasutitermitis TaxID=1652958 RepID=A0A917DZD8_9BACL|nr:ROK family protein [Paenibacillus nasutitermitis]GGD83136.1 glucokinase [Paenibacillus nasutitermitis]
MRKYAIVFDVGGLFIKAAVLSELGKVVPGTYMIYPSRSKEAKDEILSHLIDLIKQQTSRITDKHFRIEGIGYAFPGPFDYDKGISYISGIDKFEEIYGVNLREELLSRLGRESFFTYKRTPDFHIVFENDANLFALGEYVAGKARRYPKSICITIGTGAGSAFIERGELIKNRQDVPPNGWVYNQPFRESIVDDYISKRGILRLMSDAGMDTANLDIKNLAELAMDGDAEAIGIFKRFGEMIGEMLVPFLRSFQPDAVVIGGQIVKSKALFLESTKAVLRNYPITLEITDETSISTFAGVSRLLAQQKNVMKP